MTPFLTRHRRRWIAVSAMTLLAFTHAALAVSGCLSSTMPTSESGCEEHQQAASNELLCRTHMQAETQTLDLFRVPQLPTFSSPVLVLAVEHAIVPTDSGISLPTRIAVASAPPPPLILLYSRFLI